MNVEETRQLMKLLKRIQKDSRSLTVRLSGNKIEVTPAFQVPVLVSTWEEYSPGNSGWSY